MNLYSINTIKQELLFSPLVYSIKKSNYSESLLLTYNDIDNNPHQEALGTTRSILSNWLEILDYDTETKENLDKTFDLLLSSIGLFGIKPDMQKDKLINKIDNFIKDFDSKTFSDVASSVLDILKECFDPHPVLAYLYPHYYALLHSLYLYAEKSCSYEETVSQFSAKITVLLQELLYLKSSYEQAREYTQSVFIEPYADNASVPSTTSAALYHSYCKMLNKSNFYMEAFDFPIAEDCCLVKDCGAAPTEPDILMTSDLNFFIASGSDWDMEQTLLAWRHLSFREQTIFICNYHNRKAAVTYAKLLGKKVYCYPYDDDPYRVTAEKERLISAILQKKGGRHRYLALRERE